jgi:hypothetical protein
MGAICHVRKKTLCRPRDYMDGLANLNLDTQIKDADRKRELGAMSGIEGAREQQQFYGEGTTRLT